jgi:hypothetical protein
MITRFVVPVAVLFAAGCGPVPEAATVPAETSTPAPSATPAPAPSPAKAGATLTSRGDDFDVEVTVVRFRQPFTPDRPDKLGLTGRPGYGYAAVEAKVCVRRNSSGQEATVSWEPWSLVHTSGVVAETPSSWNDTAWDEPLYPVHHVLPVGRCVRGWIPFEVRKANGRPELVSYGPYGAPPLEWKISG